MGRKIKTTREAIEISLDYPTFLKSLRDHLDKRGVTRNELSKALGLHASSISQKLHGVRPLQVDEFFKLCEAAGIYPSELLPDELMSYALKKLSLFGYLEGLVKSEVNRAISGDPSGLGRFDVMLVPKAEKPEKRKPETDGHGPAT